MLEVEIQSSVVEAEDILDSRASVHRDLEHHLLARRFLQRIYSTCFSVEEQVGASIWPICTDKAVPRSVLEDQRDSVAQPLSAQASVHALSILLKHSSSTNHSRNQDGPSFCRSCRSFYFLDTPCFQASSLTQHPSFHSNPHPSILSPVWHPTTMCLIMWSQRRLNLISPAATDYKRSNSKSSLIGHSRYSMLAWMNASNNRSGWIMRVACLVFWAVMNSNIKKLWTCHWEIAKSWSDLFENKDLFLSQKGHNSGEGGSAEWIMALIRAHHMCLRLGRTLSMNWPQMAKSNICCTIECILYED